MSADLVSYGLPVLAVAVLAAAAAFVLHLASPLLRAGGRVARRTVGIEREASTGIRRCDACGKSWRSLEDRRVGLSRLLMARAVRRWCARHERAVPAWALPTGWSRCPSCLSHRVRATGAEPLPPRDARAARLTLTGAAAVSVGVLLICAAVLGAVYAAPNV